MQKFRRSANRIIIHLSIWYCVDIWIYRGSCVVCETFQLPTACASYPGQRGINSNRVLVLCLLLRLLNDRIDRACCRPERWNAYPCMFSGELMLNSVIWVPPWLAQRKNTIVRLCKAIQRGDVSQGLRIHLRFIKWIATYMVRVETKHVVRFQVNEAENMYHEECKGWKDRKKSFRLFIRKSFAGAYLPKVSHSCTM